MTILDNNIDVLEVFLENYMSDMGITVHLVEQIDHDRFAGLLATACADLKAESFDLERVISGAPSLDFLVRYALMADRRIIPRDVIPVDEVVEAALVLFHASQQKPVNTTTP
jgi:hypothetical protein